MWNPTLEDHTMTFRILLFLINFDVGSFIFSFLLLLLSLLEKMKDERVLTGQLQSFGIGFLLNDLGKSFHMIIDLQMKIITAIHSCFVE